MRYDAGEVITAMVTPFTKEDRVDYDKAAYLTASKLGKEVGVSESTVVRFAIELGFDGYPGLQHSLQEIIRTRLTTKQRMVVANTRIGNGDILRNVLESDIDNIRRTLDEINHDDFNEAVQKIIAAKNIYILGVRSSASLASFFGFYLNLISPNVRNVRAGTASELFEEILRIDDGDVFIGISFFYVGYCPCLRERIYNSRLIYLCHCFFSHIWFLLLLVALSPFVSLFCGLAVLCFACLGCVVSFHIHPLPFLLGVLDAIWAFMLLFSNLCLLFS